MGKSRGENVGREARQLKSSFAITAERFQQSDLLKNSFCPNHSAKTTVKAPFSKTRCSELKTAKKVEVIILFKYKEIFYKFQKSQDPSLKLTHNHMNNSIQKC